MLRPIAELGAAGLLAEARQVALELVGEFGHPLLVGRLAEIVRRIPHPEASRWAGG